MQSLDEKIDILAAARKGVAVQRIPKRIGSQVVDWQDFNFQLEEDFNFDQYVFRVKPQPREVFVNEYAPGSSAGPMPMAATSIEEANTVACRGRIAIGKYVEV